MFFLYLISTNFSMTHQKKAQGPSVSMLPRNPWRDFTQLDGDCLGLSRLFDFLSRFERGGGWGKPRRTNASRRRPLGSLSLCAEFSRARPPQLEPRPPIRLVVTGLRPSILKSQLDINTNHTLTRDHHCCLSLGGRLAVHISTMYNWFLRLCDCAPPGPHTPS